ncbi:MAG: D-tyrosyl-tRNA(Tyr) deacylase [Muribaculaceae bacterium]|nr:D-tyrosyl-tRNA(Tyr) deacylase [Muribaculaceae bacterium]
MRLVIQRVSRAAVSIGGELRASIGRGLMVLVGVAEGDTREDALWLAAKTMAMRIFPDDEGVMNRSVTDVGGDLLAVSQFTLNASTRKGNRPSYIRAAGHDLAIPLYELYCAECARLRGGEPVKTGVFGADMQVELVNDGPVTIVIDSRLRE